MQATALPVSSSVKKEVIFPEGALHHNFPGDFMKRLRSNLSHTAIKHFFRLAGNLTLLYQPSLHHNSCKVVFDHDFFCTFEKFFS